MREIDNILIDMTDLEGSTNGEHSLNGSSFSLCLMTIAMKATTIVIDVNNRKLHLKTNFEFLIFLQNGLVAIINRDMDMTK